MFIFTQKITKKSELKLLFIWEVCEKHVAGVITLNYCIIPQNPLFVNGKNNGINLG